MSRLRIGQPYWIDVNKRRTVRFPKLRSAIEADVAIVGGGITGCACAYLLRQSGTRVVLLEAGRIGHGSTAASTALLMQEPDIDFVGLSERYGAATAARIWRTGRQAVRDLTHTLRRIGMRPTPQRLPSVYFSQDAGDAPALRRELTHRHRARIEGQWLSPRALERMTGIPGAGGILVPGNAQIDPFRACQRFALAASSAGAKLFAHSRVQRIRSSRHAVVVELKHGRVVADRVIVATGYATPEFLPLQARFRMMNTYVIATPKLSRGLRDRLGLRDVMLWDTNRPYHYARWTPDRRLLFGGRDRPRVQGDRRERLVERTAGELASDLGLLYPALRDVTPEYAWEGLFAATPDGLPYVGVHRHYPRHLFALGYGGNGMTFGFLGAQILNRMIHSTPGPDDALFAFGRDRQKRRSIARSHSGL